MSKLAMNVKLVTKDGKRDELVDAFADYLPEVESEEGTLVYAIHTDSSDENAVWVYELYTDQDALMAHSSSEAFKGISGKLADLLEGPPELIVLTPAHAKGLDV